jgi:hypothetical protein
MTPPPSAPFPSLPVRNRSAAGALRSAALVGALVAGTAVGLCFSSSARAEAPRFQAEVDRNQVVVGESFIYQVTLGVGNERVSDYRPPEFKGLRVLGSSGPNQSTQMQFGGAGTFVEVSYSWRYELTPTQKGMVTIAPARVKVNGQEFRTGTVTVSAANLGSTAPPPPISPNPAQPAPNPAQPLAPGTATPVPAPRGALPAEAAGGGSFIRVVADKPKVFVGEAIGATWYLYMNQPVDKFELQSEPHTEGFWTEDVQVPSRRGALVQTEETVEGRPYQVAAVLKKALFPLQVGKLTITPMEARISRSDFFGNSRGQQVRSVPTVIEVQPLPRTGQPAGFDSANVGTFTMAAKVDRSRVSVGEAVTLTIEVSGRGNVRKLALPPIPKLAGWKSYEPRVTVTVDPASGITGTKTAEVLLLPERPGGVTIPPLGLDTFDPEANRYARAETPALVLTATGDGGTTGAGPVAAPAPGTAGGGFAENVIAGEIRPIHTSGGLRRDLGTTFFHTRGFLGLVAVPPLGLALVILGLRARDRLSEDTGARRRRTARRKVRAHLAAADAHRRKSESGPFFIELDRVMREALSSRLGAPVKGLRMDELRVLLSGRGVAAADVDRLIALLEECDRARFAPGSVDTATLGSTLEQAAELIDVVERMPLGGEGHP